ncbi:hypothetical protein R1sor_002530 [Riccia sorocarpa]|uniref:Transmembrane protein n=1 Tax=Riccia sorocarpa TaxID=122646 RepID=A0ABD3GZF2_9MARC
MLGLSAEEFRAVLREHDEESLLSRLFQPQWTFRISIQKSSGNNQRYLRIDSIEKREERVDGRKQDERQVSAKANDTDSDLDDFTPRSQRSFLASQRSFLAFQKLKQKATVRKINNPIFSGTTDLEEDDDMSVVESSSATSPVKKNRDRVYDKKAVKKSSSRQESSGVHVDINPVNPVISEGTSRPKSIQSPKNSSPAESKTDGLVLQAFALGFVAGISFSTLTLAPAFGFAVWKLCMHRSVSKKEYSIGIGSKSRLREDNGLFMGSTGADSELFFQQTKGSNLQGR